MEKKETKSGVSRREFLKDAGLVVSGIGATALIGSVSPAKAAPADGTVPGDVNNIPEGVAPIQPIAPPLKWDYETDVVVLGTGGSGGAATVAALEAGAQVITLEKNSIWGGHVQFSIVWGVPSALIALGSPLPQTTIQQLWETDMELPNATAAKNEAIARIIANKFADNMKWLQDISKGSLKFATGPADGIPAVSQAVSLPVDPNYIEPANATYRQQSWYQWFPYTARGFAKVLKARAEELNATIMYETPAVALVQSGGRVVGVKARKAADGSILYIKCKALVIATGGFQANKAMLEYYMPPRKYMEIEKYIGLPSAAGDGLRMIQGVGGDVTSLDEVELWDGGVHDPKCLNGPKSFYSAANQLSRQPSLTVNKLGKRFFNEGRHAGNIYSHEAKMKGSQPDATCFTILDSRCISKDDIVSKFNPANCEFPTPWFEEDFARQLADGIIMKSDSLAGLAALMGVDATTFQATVSRYNALCSAGFDADFFKDPAFMQPLTQPPYYTTKSVGGSLWLTYGGARFDENLRVVNKDLTPIPGLYVAGETAAYLGEVSRVITTGRLAGQNAANEAQGS